MITDDLARKIYYNDDHFRPWLPVQRSRPLPGRHVPGACNRPLRPRITSFGIPRRSHNRDMLATLYQRDSKSSPQSQSYSGSPGYGSYGGSTPLRYGSQPPNSGVGSSAAPASAYGFGATPSTGASAIPPVGPPSHGSPGYGMAPPPGGYGGPPRGADYNRPPGRYAGPPSHAPPGYGMAPPQGGYGGPPRGADYSRPPGRYYGSPAPGGQGPMPGGPGGDYVSPTDYGGPGGRGGFQGNNSSPIMMTERRLSDTMRIIKQKGQVTHPQRSVPLSSAAENEVTCGVKFPKGCSFCRKNGESAEFYKKHQLRDASSGNVLCPILRAYICKYCGARGDEAHTISYCPLLKEKKMEELKNKK